jgi:signal transduction histidine kinase/ligand-binding sensor domain-containing protein
VKVVVRLIGFLFAGMAAADASLLSEFTVRRWGVEDGLPQARVVFVEQRVDGYLWCATLHRMARFDGVRFVEMPVKSLPSLTQTVITNLPQGIAAEDVTATMTEADGTLWVGTWRGVYRWQAGQWSALTPRDGVFPCDVRCLATDREGNVWMGTSGGLVRLRRKRVTVFHTGLRVGSESVTALLAESPTNLWVGVAGLGLLAGAPETLRAVRFGALPVDATVSSLLRGRDGMLWVGTQGDSLWRKRPDGRVSVVPVVKREGMLGRGISALLEDRQGRVWVGTWRGLMQVNSAGKLEAVERVPADPVHSLREDRAGRVWVGFQQSGLACFHTDNRVELFQEKDGVPDGAVLVVCEDDEGTLWIGTTAGLARWRGTERHRFTTANGLADDVILQIIEGDAGDLWLGTRNGLMRVRTSEFDEIIAGRKTVVAARQLGLEAGMDDEECTGRLGARAAKTADGRLWFPTMEGIVMVEPRKIPLISTPPPVYVEEILANGGRVPWRSGDLRLPLGMRNVEIRFTAPTFTAPERTHFKFQLAGYDSNWARATPERTVRYAKLGTGTYRFRVMARDRDSAWSEPTAPLVVIVPPFFWETTWFALLAVVTALTLVATGIRGYYRRRGMRELQEMEQRTALERERSRIARDIHDEVGAGLTEVAMLSELAQEDEAHPGELREHLDGIFRRARELAQSLNEIVWAINPANDTLESFLSYIGEFAQEFLGVANMACRLELPSDPPPLTISASIRHHLSLAIKEALHNTVKHADATEVRLSVTLADRTLSVAIQDNGRGFTPDAKTGVGRDGLDNLRKRLAEIGGQFRQESEPGRGTRTELSVELPTSAAIVGAVG